MAAGSIVQPSGRAARWDGGRVGKRDKARTGRRIKGRTGRRTEEHDPAYVGERNGGERHCRSYWTCGRGSAKVAEKGLSVTEIAHAGFDGRKICHLLKE